MLKEAAEAKDSQQFVEGFGELCSRDELSTTGASLTWPIENGIHGETLYRIKLCLSGGREKYSFSVGRTAKEKRGEVVGRSYISFDRSGRLYFVDRRFDDLADLYGKRDFSHPHSSTVTSYAQFPKFVVSHLVDETAEARDGVLEVPVSQGAFDTHVRPFMLVSEFCERVGNMVDYINTPNAHEPNQRKRLVDHWRLSTRGNHPVGAMIQMMRKKNLVNNAARCLSQNGEVTSDRAKQYARQLADMLQREYPTAFTPRFQPSKFHLNRAFELVATRQHIGAEPFRKLAAYANGDWKKSPREY